MRSLWMLLLVPLATGCGREPSREWSPADHDQAGPPPSRSDPAEAQAQLIEVSWSRQCATCHGPTGHGDGPSGPMVQAPDLSRAAWQDSVTDEQIGRVILEGKGRMPRFDLPPATVAGLVRRVRQLRGR
jgi:mono/diheme cytochrome c family protein